MVTAREFFEEVRDASRELWRHDRRWDAMEHRALSLGGMGGSTISTGSIADRTKASDALVDFEASMERRVAEWCDLVDRGAAILYGADWQHGIASSIGIGYAEVIECIYIQRLSLTETARRTKYSKSTVQRMRSRALRYIDAVGFGRAEAGE